MSNNTPSSEIIWHPFTRAKGEELPIHIQSGKGTLLFDEQGKSFIDSISSWWVNIHGHAQPFIAEQIYKQAQELEHVIFAGFTHTPAKELAASLIKLLPSSFSKLFFSDNGSTAVEVSIKIALQYWHNQNIKHKTKIIAFENAYHGDTFGAMSVGAKSTFNLPFQQHLFSVDHIPVPTAENLSTVKQLFSDLLKSGEVAAFIFEPLVQGAGGMLMHEAKHLDELLKIAKQQKVVCIADEVMTGFGRTGKNFAIEYLTQQADIICLSKGITGGFMPLGVSICTSEIFEAFNSDNIHHTFFHGHSYTANPLSCAAANASMQLLVSDACQQQIKWIESQHQQFADSLKAESLVKNIRHTGTIIAFELETTEKTSYFNSIKKEISNFCLNEGVLLRPLGNVVYIMPPYCITATELEKVYAVIKKLILHLHAK
jgi:adenosylmethionine-8-amino-7-oxononanoate aminotransferase